MLRQSNNYLLKEYIKTLIAEEVLLPSIQPRGWSHEFSRFELQAIYANLRFVIATANPRPRQLLLEEFSQIEDPTVNMHWFLNHFWNEIEEMLVRPTDPLHLYPLLEQ